MKLNTLMCIVSVLLASAVSNAAEGGTVLQDELHAIPLAFEKNRGQAGTDFEFLAHAGAYTALFSRNRTILLLPPANVSGGPSKSTPARTLAIEFQGCDASSVVEGQDLLPGKTNYYIGNDPARWIFRVPQFARVRVSSLYPGIDLIYYGNNGRMDHDFILSPGANSDLLKFQITGADRIELSSSSGLVLRAGEQDVELQEPVAYQEENGVRRSVAARYVLTGKNQVSFLLGSYDRSKPLVIDPILSYSTLIGANSSTNVQGIAVDTSGSVYLTGTTFATNYPTVNAFQSTNAGYEDVFVTKLNPAGNQILYSTYLGGSDYDFGRAIAVDNEGSAYITGSSFSSDFPTTPNAFMTKGLGNTPFVTKFRTDGSLAFSTFMGGGNVGANAIAVDSEGEAYITGTAASDDLPTTPGSFDPIYNGMMCTSCYNGFVEKLNAAGSALIYGTYFGLVSPGGFPATAATGIAVDSSGSAYLVGNTVAIPVQNALQPSLVDWPSPDAFIAKFSPDGSSLVFSTYLGGTSFTEDNATGVAVDPSDNVHVVGTSTSCDFPLTLNAISTDCATNSYDQKVFALVLNSTGSRLLFSTFIRSGWSSGIATDTKGNSVITGLTTANDLPLHLPIENNSQRSQQTSFVTAVDLSGKILFSTYLGATGGAQATGVAIDSHDAIYVTGAGQGNFPLVNPIPSQIQQPTPAIFVAKISPANTPQISLSPRISPTLTLRNVSTQSVTINSIVPSKNFTQGGNCGATLAPGSGCTLIEEGANDHQTQGTVTITADGQSQQFTIYKSPGGDNVQSAITIFPVSLQFPTQFIGTTSATQKVEIQNLGLQPGAINSITLGEPSAFTETNNCPPVLPPSASCTVTVKYIPQTAGDSGYISVVHDPLQQQDTIGLSGNGSTSAFIPSTSFLEFGSQLSDGPLLARVANFANTTPYPATINSVTTSTGFVQSNTCAQPVLPHASCRVAVAFQPTTNQNATGTLTANNYGPGGSQVVALSGTGLIDAALTVSPVALDFQNVFINQTYPQDVTLTNASNAFVQITKIQAGAPFSESDNCQGGLDPGVSCTVSVSFTPTQLGPASSALTVTFGGKGSPQVVGLTGTGVTILRFDPSPLIFGQQQVGTPSPQTYLTIDNGSGQQTITLNSITVRGNEFAMVQNFCPSQLPPYYGCSVVLVFTPSATGLRTGQVIVSASDYAQNHIAPLQGTGVGAGQLSLSATSLTFGPQKVGTKSAPQYVTLTNTGTGVVTFAGISSSPKFFVSGNNCGTSLAPGGSCKIGVRFDPIQQGIVVGGVTISDDSLGGPHGISLTGVGK